MSEPGNIFIKLQPEWSYSFIGAMKEFMELDTLVVAKLYNVATHFLVLRHNFIWGHIDNVRYTALVNELFAPFAHCRMQHHVMNYYAEDLYRRCRPVLDIHRNMLRSTLFYNDDKGDVIGTVFQYVQPFPISTLQFA